MVENQCPAKPPFDGGYKSNALPMTAAELSQRIKVVDFAVAGTGGPAGHRRVFGVDELLSLEFLRWSVSSNPSPTDRRLLRKAFHLLHKPVSLPDLQIWSLIPKKSQH